MLTETSGDRTATDAVPQALSDARLHRLYRYWTDLRGERRAPPRRAIDPMQLRFLLGYLAIAVPATTPEGPTWHYRLMGTRLAEQDGVDLTGKTLDAYPFPDQREIVRAHYDRAAAEARPIYAEVRQRERGRVFEYGRLVLPLSDDGHLVDGLLIARIFLGQSASRRDERP